MVSFNTCDEYLDARWYVAPVKAIDGIEGATAHWIFDPISWRVDEGPV